MSSAKKVLFTSHTANFSKFNRPFMRWFKEQGYEVHYASAGEEEVLDCDTHFTIPFARSPFKFSNLRALRRLKKIIDTQKYDIIHTHTPMGSVITRLAAKNARKNGTRVIYTAHGFHFYKGAPLLNWLIYYPIEKWMSKYTDILIMINHEDFVRTQKNFYTKKTFKINGVGVDLTRFKPVSISEKKKLRKAYGYHEEDFILIYAAELNKNKNQSFLITQMKKILDDIPNAKLLLCGDGILKHKYTRMINKLGVSNAVTLMGYRNDMNCLFNLSDVCVTSSIREGLGLNLIEAMATGLPIIASNNRGHRDIIRQETHGYLYDIDNAEEFKKHILGIYENQQQVKKIGKNNIILANKYSLQNAVDNMIRIYHVRISDE